MPAAKAAKIARTGLISRAIEHGTDGGAERKAAVYRQIREIQYFVGDVDAQGHDRVDHALFKYT